MPKLPAGNKRAILTAVLSAAITTQVSRFTNEPPKEAEQNHELAQGYSYIWENNVTHWRDIK